MAQRIERPNVFGRILGSLGGGLSEGIQEGATKGYLSASFDRLKNRMRQGNLSPLDMYQELLTAPGVDPSLAKEIMPALRQEALRLSGNWAEEAFPQGTQGQAAAMPQVQGLPAAAATQEGPTLLPDQAKGVSPDEAFRQRYGWSPSDIDSAGLALAKQTIPVIDPVEVAKEAIILSERYPFRFPTPPDAEPFVKERKQAERERYTNAVAQAEGRLAKSDAAEKRLYSQIAKQLQAPEADATAEGLAKYLPAEVLAPALERFKDEIAAGKDEAKTGAMLARELKSFVTNGRNALASISKVNRPSVAKQAVEEALKEYRAWGADEAAVNDLQNSMGISYPMANKLYKPVNDNIKKVVQAVQKDAGTVAGTWKRVPAATYDRLLQGVEKYITRDQSLIAIGQELRDAGFDPAVFYRKVSESDLPLTDTQRRELTQQANWGANLFDIYFKLAGVL